MTAAVLILSTKIDIATDAVVVQLHNRGVPVVRLNTEDYPYANELATTLEEGKVTSAVPGAPELRSCWYRRIRNAPRPLDIDSGIHDFCMRESRAHIEGLAMTFEGPVMSRPQSIWAAERKLFQLQQARMAGLSTPATIVTNRPFDVREAFERFGGRMICKPLTTGHIETSDGPRSVFTSQVLEEHLAHVNDASISPAIYQPLVPKAVDMRVTVVGTKFFVADIDSQTDPDAAVDWRRTRNPFLPHRATELPDHVRHAISRLMQRLSLHFGAVDLIRTSSGEYIFLEVNPNGQWLWIEHQLGLDISGAVADWLALTGTDQ